MGRKVFGGGDVSIAGGASTVRQYVAAGLLDELYLHIVPIVVRAGERCCRAWRIPPSSP